MPNIPLSSFSIDSLPAAEDDLFEYKSSATSMPNLKDKISRAASAFCNSGGGYFVTGVKGDGTPDGGISKTVGRQPLRDWVDQAIAPVTPPVKYEVRQFDDNVGKGTLDKDKVILVVSFPESHSAPHMADDKKYYIRAGAHSVPAAHFIVESLWARRGSAKPLLSHAIREKPGSKGIIQVGIVALNSAPALDVEFRIEPMVGLLGGLAGHFPIRLPVVDQNTPFFLDATYFQNYQNEFPDNVVVRLKYHDVGGHEYDYCSSRPLAEAVSPVRMGGDPFDRIVNAIEKLTSILRQR